MDTYDIVLNYQTDSAAIEWAARFIFSECEIVEQQISDYRYVDTVQGVDVYYHYGADYHFFAPSQPD